MCVGSIWVDAILGVLTSQADPTDKQTGKPINRKADRQPGRQMRPDKTRPDRTDRHLE